MKKCRCGRRIPSDWRICAQCRVLEDQDRLEDGLSHRLERAQLVRVRRSMSFEVTPVLDPEEQQALLNGIARLAQQDHLLKIRHDLKNRQHISVLYGNARAYSMDMEELTYDD